MRFRKVIILVIFIFSQFTPFWKLTCPGFELAAPLGWWYDIVIIALYYQLSSICSLQLLHISILWLWQILFGNTYIFLYCFLIVLWLVLFICSFDIYSYYLLALSIFFWLLTLLTALSGSLFRKKLIFLTIFRTEFVQILLVQWKDMQDLFLICRWYQMQMQKN